MLLSDPTTETLRDAGCVVAVAPDGYADRVREIEIVGVAYDGSSASDGALALARRLARETGAGVSALDVVAETGVGPTALRFQRAAMELQAASDLARPENVTGHIAFGDPVEELSGLSSTVDILVAGARGPVALARLLHPSTTARLSGIVSCPLVVLTKAAREREAITEPLLEPAVGAGEN